MKFKRGEILKDVFFDVLGAFLYSAGIYSFAVAGSFAPGGVTGLSIIINHFFSFIPIGLCSIVINIPIILLTCKTLGKKFFIKSVISMVILALTLDFVFPHLPIYTGNPLLAAVFAGALAGIGLSFIYMRDSSTGGTDFVIMSLRKKYPHMSIGTITMIIDGCILILNGFAFGNVEAVLYGAILTYVSTVFIDKLMYGINSRKKVIIVTSCGMNIAKEIGEKVERGVTLVNAIGTYTGSTRQLLICVCSNREVIKIKRIAYDIDKNSLIFVDTSDNVYGEGFQEIDNT